MRQKCEVSYLCQNPLCQKYKLKRNEGKDNILYKYNWAKRYKCDKCKAIFYSCKWCNTDEMTSNLLYRSRLCRHHQRHCDNEIIVHRRKKMKSDQPIIDIYKKEDNSKEGGN